MVCECGYMGFLGVYGCVGGCMVCDDGCMVCECGYMFFCVCVWVYGVCGCGYMGFLGVRGCMGFVGVSVWGLWV